MSRLLKLIGVGALEPCDPPEAGFGPQPPAALGAEVGVEAAGFGPHPPAAFGAEVGVVGLGGPHPCDMILA